MYLPDFDYYAPESVAAACGLLAKHGSKAKLLAGGTDLLHKMKHGELAPEVIVSLTNLNTLKEIQYVRGTGLIIGARVTQNDLANSPLVQEKYRSVSEAAHHMANNQIRHLGTVGGNIVNAVPSADLPPILIALGATIKLAGPAGEREMLLEDFFLGVHRTQIQGDEILTKVIIPEQDTSGSTYIRFGLRRSGALAVASSAVSVTMAGEICRSVKIALGAAAPVPLRARKAEAVLLNQRITDELMEKAGVEASKECSPRNSIRGSEEYRRDLIRVLTRRALKKAITEGHV